MLEERAGLARAPCLLTTHPTPVSGTGLGPYLDLYGVFFFVSFDGVGKKRCWGGEGGAAATAAAVRGPDMRIWESCKERESERGKKRDEETKETQTNGE